MQITGYQIHQNMGYGFLFFVAILFSLCECLSMVAKIRTVSFQGITVCPIDVEVNIANGLPAFTIVGLPDKAVGESRERVRSALHSMGLSLPPKRITINLAPADVSKEGSHYDLPIALGLLVGMGIIPNDAVADYVALGEMGLDGTLRAVSGILPSAMYATENDLGLICPDAGKAEAAWSGLSDILPARNLIALMNHFKGTQLITQDIKPTAITPNDMNFGKDMADIKGQESARRALEIAAAGRHNMLMSGQPGSGKSMLAERLPTIMPPLSAREALDVSMIHSLAGTLPENGLVQHRPFRNPHHSASLPALIGGGMKAKPGEISLAHQGVLFLDELPEFNRATIESLRQPMETGEAVIARVNSHATYPADFQLIGAMNPCKCGYLGATDRECTRAPKCGLDYQAKLSGPFLDRMDIFVDVPAVSVADLRGAKSGEDSKIIRNRVTRAHDIQYTRNGIGRLNASLSSSEVEKLCVLDDEANAFFDKVIQTLNLSARGYHRVLKVARTIADLNGGKDKITKPDLAEAISLRPRYYSNT
jgi:magnesium chelatase family protein